MIINQLQNGVTMKTGYRIGILLVCSAFVACNGTEPNEEISTNIQPKPAAEKVIEAPASVRITKDNKGVGEIKELQLNPTIDLAMVDRGAALFKTNCTACHKTDKRFIGPNPTDILERRSPEWIMNMILNPKLMTEEDQCAKDLLVEFNGAAMANQNMTVEQAREILEYFRTLKS
jgi:cytochrome c